MKVALVHYWLVGMRGGEKVLEALCRLYPEADIYTHVYNPLKTSDLLKSHKIRTTFINHLPFARRWYKNYLPFMPLALEQLDLSGYDLVISNEAGPAKGVIVDPDSVHICYCNSPMRYLWDMYHEYTKSFGVFRRICTALIMHYLRIWDTSTANFPDIIVANSRFVARRIKRFWGRDCEIVPPPVDVGSFNPLPREKRQNFYLLFGELVPYKRADLAVRAFSRPDSPYRLFVMGSGEQMSILKKIAGPNITFLGQQPFEVVQQYLSSCKALVFPGLEDFGIIPVEALACGTPVIAYGHGGVLDTVKEGISGVFFHKQTEEDLLAAIREFENKENSFEAAALVAEAELFKEENFARRMEEIIAEAFKKKGRDFILLKS